MPLLAIADDGRQFSQELCASLVRCGMRRAGLLGGAAGIAAGALATGIYASVKHWAIVIPALAWAGGAGAAIAIGAIAGLLPALRAARLSPTEALRTA
jgi:ABC-type antimicrobial peptide transport system permease subunit